MAEEGPTTDTVFENATEVSGAGTITGSLGQLGDGSFDYLMSGSVDAQDFSYEGFGGFQNSADVAVGFGFGSLGDQESMGFFAAERD